MIVVVVVVVAVAVAVAVVLVAAVVIVVSWLNNPLWAAELEHDISSRVCRVTPKKEAKRWIELISLSLKGARM